MRLLGGHSNTNFFRCRAAAPAEGPAFCYLTTYLSSSGGFGYVRFMELAEIWGMPRICVFTANPARKPTNKVVVVTKQLRLITLYYA